MIISLTAWFIHRTTEQPKLERKLENCHEVPSEPSLLQGEKTQLPQCFLTGQVLQQFDHLCHPPLDPLFTYEKVIS